MKFLTPSVRLLVLLVTLASTAFASTWYADGVNGSDSNNCMSAQSACKTIGHAISLAHSGDYIRVTAATYTENLTIPFSLDIIGANAKTTIIDGGRVATTVTIPFQKTASHVVLANLTIQNGLGVTGPPTFGDGGGVFNNGILMIIYCTITGNRAISTGGGVWSANSFEYR